MTPGKAATGSGKRTISMHYSLESHMACEQAVLSCGCRINETMVLAMCIEHADTLRKQRAKRDEAYAEFHRHLEAACERKKGKP